MDFLKGETQLFHVYPASRIGHFGITATLKIGFFFQLIWFISSWQKKGGIKLDISTKMTLLADIVKLVCFLYIFTLNQRRIWYYINLVRIVDAKTDTFSQS